MYCNNCGTYNPEGAKFCKNCGHELNKKAEYVEKPIQSSEVKRPTVENTNQYQQPPTSDNNNSGSSSWLSCCVCLIGLFIIFAIFSH